MNDVGSYFKSKIFRLKADRRAEGRPCGILNAPALAVLNALERVGPYVVPGDDLKHPATT